MTKNVRLMDLARRRQQGAVALLSVRLPVELIDRIDSVVDRLNSSKAAVVVALLNEGLVSVEGSAGGGKRRKA